MPPHPRACETVEALTLLDALVCAPAAAALVSALDQLEDRRALRLVCTQLRDAVGEATTKLSVPALGAAPARPATPARWPRLEVLTLLAPDLEALEALGAGAWGLRSLRLGTNDCAARTVLGVPTAHALAAALRRMPALLSLDLRYVELSAAGELFCASETAPQLRALTLYAGKLSPAVARMLAPSNWRLEELDLSFNHNLGSTGVAALLASTFAIRRLDLKWCGLDAAALFTLANVLWPLEELNLAGNRFRADAAAPALAALSQQHTRLRKLNLDGCKLSVAGFKVLVEATWPALISLGARDSGEYVNGAYTLGDAAFAGFPMLEELDLHGVKLGEAGAALLASRRWERLKKLDLSWACLFDAGVAALACGAWPALEVLDLVCNGLHPRPTFEEDVRRWAPALKVLKVKDASVNL